MYACYQTVNEMSSSCKGNRGISDSKVTWAPITSIGFFHPMNASCQVHGWWHDDERKLRGSGLNFCQSHTFVNYSWPVTIANGSTKMSLICMLWSTAHLLHDLFARICTTKSVHHWAKSLNSFRGPFKSISVRHYEQCCQADLLATVGWMLIPLKGSKFKENRKLL